MLEFLQNVVGVGSDVGYRADAGRPGLDIPDHDSGHRRRLLLYEFIQINLAIDMWLFLG